MSWQAVEAVFQFSHSKGSARLLLLCIAHHAQPDGTGASVAVPTLEDETKIDRTRIRKIIKVLENELGELAREIGGGRVANTYSILLPIGKPAHAQERALRSEYTPQSERSGASAAHAQELPVHKQTAVETSVVLNKEQTTTGRATLLAELEAEGVVSSVALELVSDPKYLQRVPLQLACLSDREPKDRAAVLVKSIKENWKAPAAYVQRERAREMEAAESARRAQALALQNQRREKEAQVLAATEAENTALDAKYLQMTEAERANLDAQAITRLGPIARRPNSEGALLAMRRNLLREREAKS